MYQVDGRDRVVELEEVPQSSVGAPCPFVVSDEHSLVLAFYLEEVPDGWNGTAIRVVGPKTGGEPVAIVNFPFYDAFMFSPPNDEAFMGHPLASRGLRPYSANVIEESSWIRQLERMNSVHPHHDPRFFEELKHYIFAFHDSVFECVAREFTLIVRRASIASLVPEMCKLVTG